MVVLPLLGLGLALIFLFKGLIGFPEVVAFAAMYVVTAIGISVGLHRLFTHDSFKAVPIIRYALAIAGSMADQGPLVEWVAIHRLHHRFADREGDPHSPYFPRMSLFRGLWHSHIGWVFEDNPSELSAYAGDILADPGLVFINRFYYLWVFLGLLIPGIACWILDGNLKGFAFGVLCGGFVRMFVVHHITWSINSVCHIWGSRPFATLDKSTNNPVLALVGVGEGWHNNHHAFPFSASHGFRWWQLDLSYCLIVFLETLGLVSSVKVPTKEQIDRKQTRAWPEQKCRSPTSGRPN